MRLEFSIAKDRWSEFYTTYGIVNTTEPNAEGWVNFPCCLPTHPKRDKAKHGSINLNSGVYRCWNEECRHAYASRFNKPESIKGITPREFLQLTQGFTQDIAQVVVEEYRKAGLEKEFSHHDSGLTKKFCAPVEELNSFVEAAQQRLKSDLLIVQEYCISRQLRFETLVKAGIGYVPETLIQDENGKPVHQEECLILPYYLNGQVVSVRGRTIDGRKGGIKNSYTCLYNLDSVGDTTSRTCIIVEGETDTLRMRQLLEDYGLQYVPVFGTPGVAFQHEWKRHLSQFTRVLTVPQADDAAKQFIKNLREEFPDRLEIVNLPWKPRQFGKDIVDFLWANKETGSDDLIHLLGITDEDLAPTPRILSAQDFRREAKRQIPWVVPNLLERGTKTLLVGEPKTYKTWIALQLAKSVTTCTPFMGTDIWTPEEPGRVLIVEEEGALHRISQRLELLCQDTGIPDNLFMLHRQGVLLDDPDSLLNLKQDILTIKPDLVILDPYANLHLQDENTVVGTMTVMSAINQLMRTYPDMAVVIIHHTPKGGKGARGSGALYGAVDLQILVSRVDGLENTIRFGITGRDFIEEASKTEFEFDSAKGMHKIRDGFDIPSETKEKLTLVKVKAEDVYEYVRTAKDLKTLEEIRQDLNLSQYSARLALKALIDAGRLESIGGGRRSGPVKYQVKEVGTDASNNESTKNSE